MEFLKGGEKTVTEIVEHLDLPQNRVSMHLGCLRSCAYVHTRKEGRFVLYSLADSRVSDIMDLAKSLLQRSEAHMMTCDVIGRTDEYLTNLTG